MPATKKVFVKTFGCQMNVYDSERIAEALGAHGYVETSAIEAADLVVLNTCHIREKAVEKVYSDLGKVRDVKAERLSRGLSTQVVVAGCVAQAEGAEISARAPVVDVVIGSQSYHRLPELLVQAHSGGRRIVETRFPEEEKFALLPERTIATGQAARIAAPASAFLTVQEGCDKFCTFCVVPYTRGAEYSRSVGELVAETERLVMRGVREITLLGQNVNGYHGEGPGGGSWSLARLIRHLAGIEGVERLRYMTSHPRDMADDLIAAHRDEPKLMPFLHLPVQSGSDRILAAMNRKHTAKDYLTLLDRIRSARPDIAVSTDIIVGFPGETDKDFAATLELDPDGRIRAGVLVQVQPAARYASGEAGFPGAGKGEVGAAARTAGVARRPADALQCKLCRPHACRCCSSARAGTRGSSSAAHLISSSSTPKRRPTCWAASFRSRSPPPVRTVSRASSAPRNARISAEAVGALVGRRNALVRVEIVLQGGQSDVVVATRCGLPGGCARLMRSWGRIVPGNQVGDLD